MCISLDCLQEALIKIVSGVLYRHKDNKLIYETIPAIEFAKRFMRHILERHFKMIRYTKTISNFDDFVFVITMIKHPALSGA